MHISSSTIRNKKSRGKARPARPGSPKSKIQNPKSPIHPLYPKCDGQPWEDGGLANAQQKLKSEFLEAYFRINLAYARLLEFRKKRPARSSKSAERAILQMIEKALVDREALEDRHAPRGVVATPVYRDGFTMDVLFTDARTGQQRGSPLIASSASVRITLALPAGLRVKPCKS